MLHSRLLRYLEEVSRAGSIRAAAERLNVASSAINRHILELEAELGTPLFQRLPRRLRLTAAGEVVIAHVRETLKAHDAMQARLAELAGLRSGHVTIATMGGLASGILPSVVEKFRIRHPRIVVTTRVLFINDIVRAIQEAEADLGLGYNLPDQPSLHVAGLFDGRLGAVVSAGHPLASRGSVRLFECVEFPIVLADRDVLIHRMVCDAFERANVPMQPACLSNSIEHMKAMVLAGEGVAFLSRFDIAEDLRAGTLAFVRIEPHALGRNPLKLVHAASRSLDLAASLFAEGLSRRLQDLVEVA